MEAHNALYHPHKKSAVTLVRCLQCRNEMFGAMKHNQFDLEELRNSDDDFDDEVGALFSSKGGMDEIINCKQITLRSRYQFDSSREQEQMRKQSKSVQRILCRICSVRYVDQHLFYRKSYVLHIYLTGIQPKIWREIRVPARLSLSVFQKIFDP